MTNVPAYTVQIDVSWMNMSLSRHAWYKAHQRHITIADIQEVFDYPDKSHVNRGHVTQLLISRKDIVLIGEPIGNTFEVVTVYSRRISWTPAEKAEHDAEALRSKEISAKGAIAAAAVFAACHRK